MNQRGTYPLTRLSLAIAEKHRIHGVAVAIGRFINRAEKAEIIEKMTVALALIEAHAPARLTAMKSDVQTVFVHDLIEAAGWYVPGPRLVEVNARDALGTQGSPEWLACLLVHEAQHARLFRLGFGYDHGIRARIEALCYRAQLIFARALPDGDRWAAWSQDLLESDLERSHTTEGLFCRRMQALRHAGCPEWSVRLLERIARARGVIS